MDPRAAAHLRSLFDDLLSALDDAGFQIAAANVDLARHSFEDELAGASDASADESGLLQPGEVPKWRAARGV